MLHILESPTAYIRKIAIFNNSNYYFRYHFVSPVTGYENSFFLKVILMDIRGLYSLVNLVDNRLVL